MPNSKLKMKAESLRGFTLIEILVVVGLLSMVILYLANFQIDLFVQSAFMEKSLVAEQQARSAMKTLISNLRAASQAADGSYPINLATDQSLTFFSDVDGDNSVEKIRYYIASSTLYRAVTKPSGTPSTYLVANEKITATIQNLIIATSTPVFSYYDSGYNGTSSTTPLYLPVDIPLVRLVKVNFNILIDPDRSPVNFISEVSIRNLKSNF